MMNMVNFLKEKDKKREPCSDVNELYENNESEKRYCPLLGASRWGSYCDEEKCMWYNKRHECAIYGFDRSLTIICEELLEIRKKLG